MRRSYLLSLLISSFFLLASCGEDEGFANVPIPTAYMMIINAIPDSPELIVSSRKLTVARVPYGRASQTVRVLPQIALDFEIKYINESGEQATLISSSETIEIDDTRIIVVSGSMAAPKTISHNAIPSEFVMDSTESTVSFLNVSSLSGNISLSLTDPLSKVRSLNLVPDEPSTLMTVSAGDSSQIEIKDPATGQVHWASGDFNFSANTERLILVIDYFGPGNNTVRMISVTEQLGAGLFANEQVDSQLRFAHMAADRGALDLLINVSPFTSTANFGDVTAYQSIANGNSTFNITTAGDAIDIIASSIEPIIPGHYYTLTTASESDEAGTLTGLYSALLSQNDRRSLPSRAILNISKFTPSVDKLDIYLLDPGAEVAGFPLLSQLTNFSSNTVDLLPKTYDFVITSAGDNTKILYGPDAITLNANGLYSLILTDTAGGGAPIRVQFLDDFLN